MGTFKFNNDVGTQTNLDMLEPGMLYLMYKTNPTHPIHTVLHWTPFAFYAPCSIRDTHLNHLSYLKFGDPTLRTTTKLWNNPINNNYEEKQRSPAPIPCPAVPYGYHTPATKMNQLHRWFFILYRWLTVKLKYRLAPARAPGKAPGTSKTSKKFWLRIINRHGVAERAMEPAMRVSLRDQIKFYNVSH